MPSSSADLDSSAPEEEIAAMTTGADVAFFDGQQQQQHRRRLNHHSQQQQQQRSSPPIAAVPLAESSTGGRAVYTASRVELKANRILPATLQQPQLTPLPPRQSSIAPSFYARVRMSNGPRRGAVAAFAAGDTSRGGSSSSLEHSSLYLRPNAAPQPLAAAAAPSLARCPTGWGSAMVPSDSTFAWRASTSAFVHRQKLLKCDTPVSRALYSSNASPSALNRALWISK